MLVVALLEPEEIVPLDEFWRRAYTCFGVMCGARSYDDAASLADWRVRQVPVTHLKENAQKILDELQRMGHARRFADGVTLIQAGVAR